MNDRIAEQINALRLGDLVRIEWFDASSGPGLDYIGRIEFPALTWGVYLGVYGKPDHLVICQNDWVRSEDFHDPDIIVIPVSWAENVETRKTQEVPRNYVNAMLRSVFLGKVRSVRMGRQRLTSRRDIIELLTHLSIRRRSTIPREEDLD